jgi:putative endonuclease
VPGSGCLKPVVELVETRYGLKELRTRFSRFDDCGRPQRRRSSKRQDSAMPHMYILRCSDGSLYVGSTWDIERRVAQHTRGEGAKYTARRLPVTLIYCEDYDRIEDAFRREKQVQNWGRAKRMALVEGRWEDLPGLSSSS